MTEKAPTYLEKLDALVEKIMDEASKDEGVKLSERVDALKICSAHYVNTQRLKLNSDKTPPDTGKGVTMDSLRERVSGGPGAAPAAATESKDDDETDSD